MTQPVLAYRWSRSEFVRASEAGAFDHRVELVEGEIWPVVTGSRHGDTVGQLLALLPRSGVRVTTATLPTGESLPDPDCWVRRADAEPVGAIGSKLSVWDAAAIGYRTRVEYLHGERTPVPYTSMDLAVDDLIAPR
jgi:hypothetical protein